MPRLQSVSGTTKGLLHEYGGWIVLLFTVYVLFSFRKVFSSLGDAAGAGAEAATAKVTAAAQASSDKAKVTAAAPTVKRVSDADVAQYKADATSMANFLGQANFGLSTVFKDQQSAFSLMKRYSRLNLYNNKPWKWGDAKKTKVVAQAAETADSVKNPVNYKVLIPFYKEATNGRDLVADFRYYVTGSQYTSYFKWFL